MVDPTTTQARPSTRRVAATSRQNRPPSKPARAADRPGPAPAASVVGAISAAADSSSWYHANFAATAGQQGSDERRTARWGLRGLNRQQGVSALKRVADCGRPLGSNPVKIKRRDDGGGHVAGVETCASVWACPVCAAVIRNHRADEISRGFAEHLRRPTKVEMAAGWKATGLPVEKRNDAEAVARYVEALPRRDPTRRELAAGITGEQAVGMPATVGGALFVTLTLPHQIGDKLGPYRAEGEDRPGLLHLVSEGFRALQNGRAYKAERAAYGVLGHIRAFEVTHGPNGWHPHLHVLLVLAAPVGARKADELRRAWLTRWNRWLTRNGWGEASEAHGVKVDLVRRDARAVAVYVAKLQEGDGKQARRTNVGTEMTRADLKRARRDGIEQRGERLPDGTRKGGVSAYRVPFEVLADFGSDGAASDRELWHEYQLATKGRSAIRWSVGLRALLLPDEPELTDGEVTQEDKGGDVIAVLTPALYRAILKRPYADAYLQVAAEQGGLDGIRRFVRSLKLSDTGVHPPEALVNWAEIEEIREERNRDGALV